MELIRLAAIVTVSLAAARSEEAQRLLVVNIPDRKIALVVDGKVVKVYDVAVGKPATPSPAGEFRVVCRVTHPAWYAKGRVVEPGRKNPVGTRWIGLDRKGYGIHGTNAPRSIGKRTSHGCIRMRNRDVEELFDLVKVGDPVELVNPLTADVRKLFAPLEAPVQAAAIATMAGGGE